MSSDDVLSAVKALEDALKCTICKGLLNDPLLIVKCGHTTCKQCFIRKSDLTCPVCNAPINSRDSLEDKQLVELLGQLKKLKSFLSSEDGDPANKANEAIGKSSAKNGPLTSTPKVNGPHTSTPKVNGPHTSTPKVNGPLTSTPKVNGPLTSTPKAKRTRTVSKKLSVPSQNQENSIQETPASQLVKTPVSASDRSRKLGGRKSSSVSSPNTSAQSPMGNINKKNHKGETQLQVAVIKGDVAKVKELLKEGAVVNTQDNNGWTPLHEASNRGFIEIAQLLLDAGALVNVPSFKDNITPLHDALLNDMMAMAILLVSRGADLHAKTSFGYTALDLCKKDGDRKVLTEACSPFIEANTLIPDTKTVSKKADKIVLLCSNLDEKQKEKLQKCAQMWKADIVDDFKPEVTHVITSCDNQGNCTRTMKILMGILTGKWIMNFNWIEVCLEYKQKVDEEVFEVQGTRNQPNSQGPKRGRQNYEQKCPPLFDGFYFYLHGTFSSPTPTREDLCNLVHLGGGKILSREPKADTIDTFMIPYHAAESPLEDTSHMILYQEKPPRERHARSGHVCTTQVMWLVACISEFKIKEPQQTNVVNK